MPSPRAPGAAAAVLFVAFALFPGCSSAPATAAAAPPATPASAVERALAWLAAHQDADGRWDSDGFWRRDADGTAEDGVGNATHDVGTTSLATLAMLGGGSTVRSGRHREALQKAVAWLQSQQGDNGLIGKPTAQDFIYDHAIATYALCEACGLSGQAELRPSAQKALDYLEAHRNPFGVWRYQPRDGDNDSSVTAWAVLALESGKFFRFTINEQASTMAAMWYDQVTTPDGRVGYTKQGEGSSRLAGEHGSRFPVGNGEALTAAGTFVRFVLGQTPEQKPVMKASLQRLAELPPKWEPGHVDSVYWYFGSMACFQAGGETWNGWSQALGTLLEHQSREGRHAGSWDPVGVWDGTGGRVFVTALNALSLQTLWRTQKVVGK